MLDKGDKIPFFFLTILENIYNVLIAILRGIIVALYILEKRLPHTGWFSEDSFKKKDIAKRHLTAARLIDPQNRYRISRRIAIFGRFIFLRVF